MRKIICFYKSCYHLIFMSMLLIACSGANISMPISDNDTGVKRSGELVWIDLVTSDAGMSQSFFTQLTGWSYNTFGTYSRAMSGTKPVCGIIQDTELKRGEKNSYWVVSASIEDLDAASTRTTENGGKILTAAKKIPERGKVAIIQDGQGAVLALMNSSRGDLRATAPREGEWMWIELWTNEPKTASNFYADVLNVAGEALSTEDNYFLLKSGERPFAGVAKLPVKDEKPIWIPVLSVADVDASSSKTAELKGSILIEPVEVSGHKLALVTTPDGAPFMLQQMR